MEIVLLHRRFTEVDIQGLFEQKIVNTGPVRDYYNGSVSPEWATRVFASIFEDQTLVVLRTFEKFLS